MLTSPDQNPRYTQVWLCSLTLFQIITNMETGKEKKTLPPACKDCGDIKKNIQDMKNTLLLQAVRAGHADGVKEALREGADVSSSDINLQNVPCSEINCLRDFDVTLNYGDIRQKLDGAFHGGPAICIAALLPREHCLEMLIKAGADVNSRSYYDHTPLMLAAHGGKFAFIDLLIKAGANVNAHASVNSHGEPLPNNRGDTALIVAVQNNKNNKNLECVKRLIDAGADVNEQSEDGSTALFYAIDNDVYYNDGCTQLLIKAGTDVNICNEESETALLWAIHKGVCINEVIEAGADVNCGAWTLLWDSATIAHDTDALLTELLILLKAGITINTQPESVLGTYLDVYEGQDKIDIVLLLAAAGEKIDKTKVEIPKYLQPKETRLKHLCREAIRKHLLELDPHTHLFGRVPRLGLPPSITDYLLYSVSLNDSMPERDPVGAYLFT